MKNPSLGMVDRDKEIFVKAELPGVDKDDLELTIPKIKKSKKN